MLRKADFDAFMKEYWTPGRAEKNTYQNRPLLAMMPKNFDIGGENWVVPIDLDDGADGGPTFSEAQTRAQNTSSQKKQFVVQYVEDFQLAQIENKVIRLSRNQPKLALEKAGRETERARNVFAQRIARNLYKSGYNDIGVVASTTTLTTKTIKLTNQVDCRNFRIGQQIVFAQTMTAALRDSGDSLGVVAIDYDNNAILTDAPTDLQTSITGIATGDVIFIKGGRGAGATPTLLTFQGLGAWIPWTAPTTGDSFNGVDRSVWTSRLAGLRYDASSKSKGEGIIDALVYAANQESYPDKFFLPGDVYGEFLKEMEGRYEKVQEKVGKIGFNGIEIQIGYGSSGVKLFPDANCTPGYGYALTMDTWEVGAAGDDLISNDLQHGEGLDLASSSGVEYRYVHTGAVVCHKPVANMVVKF